MLVGCLQAMGIYSTMEANKSSKLNELLSQSAQQHDSDKSPEYQPSLELEPAPIQIESIHDPLLKT